MPSRAHFALPLSRYNLRLRWREVAQWPACALGQIAAPVAAHRWPTGARPPRPTGVSELPAPTRHRVMRERAGIDDDRLDIRQARGQIELRAGDLNGAGYAIRCGRLDHVQPVDSCLGRE